MDIPNQLLPMRIAPQDGGTHGRYSIKAAPGTTPAHIVDPDYWMHIASRLHINDVIEVIAVDGSFDMDIRVVDIDPRQLYARVRVLRFCDGDGVPVPGAAPADAPGPVPAGIPDRDGYVVEPGASGWRVVQGRDVVASRLPSQEAAIEARETHRSGGKPLKRTA